MKIEVKHVGALSIYRKLIFIGFLFLSSNSHAQSVCIDVDSIKVYHVPWTLHTMISWSDYEVRHSPKQILDISTVTDSSAIESFLASDPLHSKVATYVKSIDVRMVIDVYAKGAVILSLSVDSSKYYSCLGVFYERNSLLIKWIEKNISRKP
jgi:hypothetical protein